MAQANDRQVKNIARSNRGSDNPSGLTARQVIEDIATFPLQKDFDQAERDITGASSSWGPSYAASRNQRFAAEWLRLNPPDSTDAE